MTSYVCRHFTYLLNQSLIDDEVVDEMAYYSVCVVEIVTCLRVVSELSRLRSSLARNMCAKETFGTVLCKYY